LRGDFHVICRFLTKMISDSMTHHQLHDKNWANCHQLQSNSWRMSVITCDNRYGPYRLLSLTETYHPPPTATTTALETQFLLLYLHPRLRRNRVSQQQPDLHSDNCSGYKESDGPNLKLILCNASVTVGIKGLKSSP
jgi:hypothetical protein